MKYTEVLNDDLTRSLEAYKKISRIDRLLKEVDGFLYNVDVINSLERNATRVPNGPELAEIPFPAAMASLILPNSVTVNGKEQDYDFLERTTVIIDSKKIWSINQWSDFAQMLYGSRKCDAVTVSVSELRKNELLASVAEISAYENDGDGSEMIEMCGYTCEERFPIPLAIMVKKDAFYSQETKDMAKDYIFRNMLSSFGK